MHSPLMHKVQSGAKIRSIHPNDSIMSTKELILAELDEEMPESLMASVLQSIRQLKSQQNREIRPEVLSAYQQSVTQREEVYRRLADS
jgi:hypothetical protein